MCERVVVLGAGYAGRVVVRALERHLGEAELTWISETDSHLVLHEVHWVVSDPATRAQITLGRRDRGRLHEVR